MSARSDGPHDQGDPNVEDEPDKLSWVDRPEDTEERRERRRARREEHRRKVKRRQRRRRIGIVGAVTLAIFTILAAVWFELTFGGLQRMPSSAGVGSGLPTGPGTTILLVGSNPSEPAAAGSTASGWQHDLAASDLVALLHLSADGRSMTVISIPGLSLLPIPQHGPGTLSQAFAAGGLPLYVDTVESLIGMRVTRVATMDLNGFREITDILGGTIVNVPDTACAIGAGPHRFDGQQALDYIALSPCLPNGDVDRVARQQSLMKALIHSAIDNGALFNPFRVSRLLKATAGHLTLEQDFSWFSMIGTLWSMRHVSGTSTRFLTVPLAATPNGTIGGNPVVNLDPAKDATLWDSLRNDQLAAYIALTGGG